MPTNNIGEVPDLEDEDERPLLRLLLREEVREAMGAAVLPGLP
jgi:hypothetical protein